MTKKEEQPPATLAKMAKHYFSIGAMIYSIVLPAVAAAMWAVLGRVEPTTFKSEKAGLAICWVLSYLVAYLLPEPYGYEGAGKMRLTKEEALTALVGGPLTFITILGARCWMGA